MLDCTLHQSLSPQRYNEHAKWMCGKGDHMPWHVARLTLLYIAHISVRFESLWLCLNTCDGKDHCVGAALSLEEDRLGEQVNKASSCAQW